MRVVNKLLKSKDGRQRLANFLKTFVHGKGMLKELLNSGFLDSDQEKRLRGFLQKEKSEIPIEQTEEEDDEEEWDLDWDALEELEGGSSEMYYEKDEGEG